MRSNRKKIVLALVSAAVLLSLAGCRKEPEPEPVQETVVVEIDDSIRNPMELTKDELLELTAPEIKEMVEAYLPNYRYVYKIDENHVMTDSDWLSLRDVICLSLYGSLRPEIEPEPEPVVYEGVDVTDPDWIYYAPTLDYIEGLDDEGFIQYLNGLFEYEFRTGEMVVEDGEKMPAVDFHELPIEDIQELRDEMIADLKTIE